MSLNSGKVLEIKITTDSKEIILEEIEKYLSSLTRANGGGAKRTPGPLVIVTPNPEQVMYASRHKRFAGILNRADVALPDGIGIVWASRLLGVRDGSGNRHEIPVRIPGVEFMEDVVRLSEKQRVRIGLIGGYGGLAVKAFECLKETYPRLDGWATDAPDIGVDGDGMDVPGDWYAAVLERVRRQKTGAVFVGLGAPKQEYLLERLARDAESGVFMAVGGSFEVLAGTTKRAPQVFRLIGFEWLWRLLIQPWRFTRQLVLPLFVLRVLRETFIGKPAKI